MSSSNLNVYAVGASRNIGYYASVRLLRKGATVTFLLRRGTSSFDGDADIQPFIASGHARIVTGDALNAEESRKGWAAASSERPVDLLLFTLGGKPNSFSLTKGFQLEIPDLVTRALLTMLRTRPAGATPRLLAISSSGITPESHTTVPLVLRPMYGVLLSGPHADKLAMEVVLAHVGGWAPPAGATADPQILPAGWEAVEGTPGRGELKVVVIRPALLSDGKCRADKQGNAAYKVSEAELGRYYVSRRDVAHFIVDQALEDWERWEGKGVNIAY